VSQHVLVVDDAPDIRAVLEAALTAEGYRVTTAASGREALATIAADRPRLLLLDLHMPEMSGQQLLAHLRAADICIQVVFMCAANRVRQEALAHAAAGYLAKPFAIADVVELADRFTDIPHPDERAAPGPHVIGKPRPAACAGGRAGHRGGVRTRDRDDVPPCALVR
jgi:two-component system response regulator MprA